MRSVIARHRAAAVVAAFALVLTPAVAEAKTINGTPHNDKLVGTKSADHINGLNGNDTISAKGGPDTVSGGTGNDTISGEGGNDVLAGNLGNDTVSGGSGDDNINTGPPAKGTQSPDNDTASGGDGNDLVTTGPGNDRLDGGAGGDWLLGADGNDTVIGGDGNDHPQGGPGNDRIYGGGGYNELDGDEGDDFMDGDAGDSACPGVDSTSDVNDCRIKLAGAAGLKAPGYIQPNITADEGDDVIYPGDGIDIAFGEQGFDTFVVTDDGVYDRFFCDDSLQDGHPNSVMAPLAQRGQIIYVSASGTDKDSHDDTPNCDPAKIFTMTPAQFMADDLLVYPGTRTHLPLPS